MSETPQQHDQEKLNESIVTDETEQVTGRLEEKEKEREEKAAVKATIEDEVKNTQGTSEIEEGINVDNDASKLGGQTETTTTEPTRDDEAELKHDTNERTEDIKQDGDKENTEPASATTQSESVDGQTEAQSSSDPLAAPPSPSHTHNSLRPISPSSRTSTPPLAGTLAPVAKKFSAINVNKKFLSKTGTSPSPSSTSPSTKLGSLSSQLFYRYLTMWRNHMLTDADRPAASPVPIAAPSRLLSTKLTTVSSTKPSTSPHPPTSASASSPWAKPTISPSGHIGSVSSLQQSSSGRTAMGGSANSQGQGMGDSRPAWRAVNADGRRPAMGMSRDFPTAKEVADGESRFSGWWRRREIY